MNLPIILPEVRRTFTLCLTHTSHGANLRSRAALSRASPSRFFGPGGGFEFDGRGRGRD